MPELFGERNGVLGVLSLLHCVSVTRTTSVFCAQVTHFLTALYTHWETTHDSRDWTLGHPSSITEWEQRGLHWPGQEKSQKLSIGRNITRVFVATPGFWEDREMVSSSTYQPSNPYPASLSPTLPSRSLPPTSSPNSICLLPSPSLPLLIFFLLSLLSEQL